MQITQVPHKGVTTIDGTKVVQVRHVIQKADIDPKYGANTKFQFGKKDEFGFCSETPDDVCTRVNADRASAGMPPLSKLNFADLQPVWFDGKEAAGPIHLYKDEVKNGVRSAFRIAEMIIAVNNTPEEVLAVIQLAGGKVLPIRPTLYSLVLGRLKSTFGEKRFFDGAPGPGI